MATQRDIQAAIAATRFGLGARPGEIAEAARDPQGFLAAQIARAGADIPAANGETSAQRLAGLRDYQQQRRTARADDAEGMVQAFRQDLRQDTTADALARARLGAGTPAAFRERWALFWANHFTVSAIKLNTATVAGPYELEAIRPHVFGRFADLLVRATTHPAMLLYLDQAQSIGPGSPLAQRRRGPRGGGLNENLAREILELHTVGVAGGYTQADVTEFARALTGLSVGAERDGAVAGEAVFREMAHEPGARTVMGRNYAAGGREQAGAILADLAGRPQTARFVCGKLARHFTADAPSAALVSRLEAVWTRTDGDLAAVARALVAAPEAWDPTPAKFKTPYEFVISSFRAVGAEPQAAPRVLPALVNLGQRPYAAPSPKGWPDEAGPWAASDALVKRMQFAQGFAQTAGRAAEPGEVARTALGARLGALTATAIARAESRPEGLTLLLMSPEFQRR